MRECFSLPQSRNVPNNLNSNSKPFSATKNSVQWETESTVLNIHGRDIPKPIDDVTQIDLPTVLLKNLVKSRQTISTPIQRVIAPIVANRRDLIANTQTDYGRVLSYLVPIIANIMRAERRSIPNIGAPHTVILFPVREMTFSAYRLACELSENCGIRFVAIIGGANIKEQVEQIRTGCDLVLSTPGRLLDMVARRIITLKHVECMVLDEFDRMLEYGFKTKLGTLLRGPRAPESEYNIIFFIDSWSRYTLQFVLDFVNDYIVMRTCTCVPRKIPQEFYQCTTENKKELLLKCMDRDKRTIVVVRDAMLEYVQLFLEEQGITVSLLHGHMERNERTLAVQMFNAGETCVVLATSMLYGECLMVDSVEHVIVYDFPVSVQDYSYLNSVAFNAVVSTVFWTKENNDQAEDLIRFLQESNHNVPEFMYRAREKLRGDNRHVWRR